MNCHGQRSTNIFEYSKYNPEYHFYPSGDPTGLFYFNGFYYNNWGSAFSTDFVHWKYTEFGLLRNKARALRQDSTISHSLRDSLQQLTRLGGSGSIVVDYYNTSGFGVSDKPVFVSLWHNGVQPWANQVIGIAYAHEPGKFWTRYEEFPVLDINSREFRDPKVFWYEPENKWIMAIGWAEIPKIKFFASSDLRNWEFLSDFGPWGAVGGVWECVDFFPLPVDEDPTNIKWVIAISVQPLTGQYFIGDFDGEKFTLDQEFIQELTYDKYIPKGEVLFDFESGLDEWVMEGEAFLESPSSQALLRQGAIMGKQGLFFCNSAHDQASSVGKIISPEFEITKNYINFLIGGGYAPGKESVNLVINGKIVRSQTGNNSGGLQWKAWDVSDYRGMMANIEIVDMETEGAGYIYADHFMICDEPARTEIEKAFWFDYGPDFFAVRSWNNYAENESRRIWVGWMGSWRYGGTEPVRGIQSIPRTVELKTFPEGIRMVQKPIKELESLRKTHKTYDRQVFEGNWVPDKIKPTRNAYELFVEFENINSKEFGLKLCIGGNEQTVVGYIVEEENLYVDRRDSGFDEFTGLFPKINYGPLKNRYSTVKLHIYIDNCSIEVFGNDGETVISSKIYPDPGSLGIELFSSKGRVRVKTLDIWELETINLDSK